MFGATLCCLGPALLMAVGLGGDWPNRLRELEPLRPVFVLFAAGYMSIAFYDLYVWPRRCPPAELCAADVLRRRRVAFWACTALVATMGVASLVASHFG